MAGWLSDNWFNLISAVGIIPSLLFTAISLRSETKQRRISNLLALTESHRAVWSPMLENSSLVRIQAPDVNLATEPITEQEWMQVVFVIQHFSSAYQAVKAGVMIRQERLREDTKSFFALPIPRAVWDGLKTFQNADFVEYVERCRLS